VIKYPHKTYEIFLPIVCHITWLQMPCQPKTV